MQISQPALPVMAKGFNHATSTCDLGRRGRGVDFSGLSVNELANAIAIATVDNISSPCVHAETVIALEASRPGSQGCALFTLPSLGQARFHRSKGLFEGLMVSNRCFAQPIPLIGKTLSWILLKQTIIEEILLAHSRPACAGAVLDLKRRNSLYR